MILQDNKYARWYRSIVETDDECAEVEKHHRIPKSLGGSDSADNIVRLSLRKHFLAHWLLTKCAMADDKRKMEFAFSAMCGRKGRIAGWQYERARRAASEAKIGRKMPRDAVERIARKKRGKPLSESHREKLSAALHGNTRCVGRIASNKTRLKMAISHRATAEPLPRNKLRLRGVHRHQGKYRARTKHQGRYIDLGRFDCPAAAHFAYLIHNDALRGAPQIGA